MQLLNNQYNELYSYYNKIQLAKHEIELKRKQEIYDKIPEYLELDHLIADLSIEATKAALEGNKSKANHLEADIAAISGKKKALLTQNHYPEDYLEPIFQCSDCKDTGYIGDAKCHCFQRRIVDFLYRESNIDSFLEDENFSRFNKDLYPDDYVEESTGLTPRENIDKIWNVAWDFCRNFENSDSCNNLLLYGNTGVGKTFLTRCIAKEILDQAKTVVYLTSLELFDILEKNKFDRHLSSLEKSTTVSYIMKCDLFIIDDLGTELNTAFTSSQLYQIVDMRLGNNKSTIISTNLSFDDLREQYSERIFSRITSSYTLLKLTGDDIRLKKALQARYSGN